VSSYQDLLLTRLREITEKCGYLWAVQSECSNTGRVQVLLKNGSFQPKLGLSYSFQTGHVDLSGYVGGVPAMTSREKTDHWCYAAHNEGEKIDEFLRWWADQLAPQE
jgi:hypothetical protein